MRDIDIPNKQSLRVSRKTGKEVDLYSPLSERGTVTSINRSIILYNNKSNNMNLQPVTPSAK